MQYLLVGIFFGIAFVKTEIISWFRIQEMFRFHSFHMYGVIGTAVVVGVISVQIIKRLGLKSFTGEEITLDNKSLKKGHVIGGLLFGAGWAITGACPGPLFVQVSAGFTVVLVTLLSAIMGTWIYGLLQKYLPE